MYSFLMILMTSFRITYYKHNNDYLIEYYNKEEDRWKRCLCCDACDNDNEGCVQCKYNFMCTVCCHESLSELDIARKLYQARKMNLIVEEV